jgi:hypothetical protein
MLAHPLRREIVTTSVVNDESHADLAALSVMLRQIRTLVRPPTS